MDYETKTDTLEASFDDIILPPERPVLVATPRTASHAFDGFLRRGEMVEAKSFTGAVNADGGYAVPREIDTRIDATLKTISPIRRIANVVTVGSAGYRKLVTQNGVASGWAAETAARPETGTPAFNEIVPPMGDLYANPAASQFMLDDAAFDVEAWLADEIATEFARAEGAAFVTGNGTNRPKGFLQGPIAATGDGVRAFGTLQYVPSGAAGAFAASNPQDKLVDLVQSLRPPYRQGAVWVMNSKTLATVRKFKTTDGAFLWQPALTEGNADRLLGYPVVEAEDMPDIATDSLSIAFGNFQAGYLIAERGETAILRDPYTSKPYVYFYATVLLDSMTQAVVLSVAPSSVPSTPVAGQSWIVGAGATGDWSGQDGALATWTAGGWRFTAAFDGMTAWSLADAVQVSRIAGVWEIGRVRASALLIDGDQVVGARQPAIADPSGGATVDAEARDCIALILEALRSHGAIEI